MARSMYFGVQKVNTYLFLVTEKCLWITWNSLFNDCFLTDWKSMLKNHFYYRQCTFSFFVYVFTNTNLLSAWDKEKTSEVYTWDYCIRTTRWLRRGVYVCMSLGIDRCKHRSGKYTIKTKSRILPFWWKSRQGVSE